MVRPKCFAKLVTPDGEFQMSKRVYEELRMLLSHRRQHGYCPKARPEVRESDYDRLEDFLKEHVRDEGYLGSLKRGGV
jgi:hypothetical protein